MRVTSNITLESITDRFTDSLQLSLNNPKIIKHLTARVPYPYTKQDAVEFINFCKHMNSELNSTSNTEKGLYLGIIKNDQLYGCVSIEVLKQPEKYVLGYWLSEKLWGQGIMTKCVNKVLSYVFDNYPEIKTINSSYYPENIGSMKILMKNGFLDDENCKIGTCKRWAWDDEKQDLINQIHDSPSNRVVLCKENFVRLE